MTAEQNYRLLLKSDANRRFILQVCRDSHELLTRAEPRVTQWIQLDQVDKVGASVLNAVRSNGEVR